MNATSQKHSARKTALIVVRLLLVVTMVLTLGCSDLEDTDNGGVFLRVDFVNVPGKIGVNDVDEVTIPSIEITSVVPNQAAGQSSLMDVLVDVYEVTYSRADTGTRVPPAFIFNRAGTIPVGGVLSLANFPVMGEDQLNVPPLSDLLFENGGLDQETGSSQVRINVTFQVFGRTIGGDDVASEPRTETLEFVPSTALTP